MRFQRRVDQFLEGMEGEWRVLKEVNTLDPAGGPGGEDLAWIIENEHGQRKLLGIQQGSLRLLDADWLKGMATRYCFALQEVRSAMAILDGDK